MFEGVQFWQVLVAIFIVSVYLSWRSMREIKKPSVFYPKMENKIRKLLSGVIYLPKSRD